MQLALEHIRDVVAQLSPLEIRAREIQPEDSLIELGMDSLRMVDLTLELEERLAVGEFPIQRWVDDEACRDGSQFTVGSLALAFSALMVRRET